MITSLVDRHLNVLAGEQQMELLLQRRNRLLDDDVVLLAAIGAPHDQADGSRCLAVDQDLALRDDRGIGDGRIGHRDPGDVELGR